jgi:hypothetical protein
MFSKLEVKKYLKPKNLSIPVLMLFVGVGLIVYARTSRGSRNAYSLAEDLPRGALVYAQFQDLPALIKQWDQSRLKQQYLNSTSYQQFQHRHLALKLVQRWEEFNDALGFQLDTAALSGATDAGAAIAIYDIGRLDLVLIAPLSEEKIAATKFFKGKEQFEETESQDGAAYYRHEVQADRGRQKQMLVFATLDGRFILATNEQLLLRAMANINRKTKKDSLSDDPAFKTLSMAMIPHFATVWVDQTKLNEDYYFKHYWLMQNLGQLKGIRAGIFDLERQDGRWIERREFLTAGKEYRKSPGISPAQAERLRAMMPADAPFIRLQSLGNDSTFIGAVARDSLFDRAPEAEQRLSFWNWRSYDTDDFYLSPRDDDSESYTSYSYLDTKFDSTINDPQDAKISEREAPGVNPLTLEFERQFTAGVQQAIGPARPVAAAVATSPYTVAGPLFVDFRRVAILTLQAPRSLRRDALENAIARAAQSLLTVAGPSADLKWVSHNEGEETWRELQLPMLGWELCYTLRDRELILANSSELLKVVLNGNRQQASEIQGASAFDDLTIIRFDQRKWAFDDIVNKLDDESIRSRRQTSKPNNKDSSGPSEEFFSGNISSLVKVAASVSRIEIKRSSAPNRLHEEFDFILR